MNILYNTIFIFLFFILMGNCSGQHSEQKKEDSLLIESKKKTYEIYQYYLMHKNEKDTLVVALKFVNMALSLDSENISLYGYKVNILFNLNYYEDALNILDKILKIGRSEFNAHELKGYVYLKQKKDSLANLEFNEEYLMLQRLINENNNDKLKIEMEGYMAFVLIFIKNRNEAINRINELISENKIPASLNYLLEKKLQIEEFNIETHLDALFP